MRDHRKLTAFRLADDLALVVYRMTAGFPRSEQFGLTSQMRRCAVSVPSNIVEGCARPGEADYVRFLEIAFASAKELGYQASLALRLGYLTDKEHETLHRASEEVVKVLSGLINSLKC